MAKASKVDETVTAPEAAEALGVSRPTLVRYAKAGMPRDTSTRPHRYNVDACRAWVRRNVRPRGGDMHDPAPLPTDDEPDDAEELLDTAQAQELYRRERALKTKAERELRDLKLAEERGELIRAADVQKVWSEAAVKLRSRLLRIPAELAAPCYGAASELDVEEILRGGVRAALEEISAAE